MLSRKTSLLSLAPYRLIPAQSGGQLGILLPHHYMGKRCPNQLVGTVDNGPASSYAFHLHPLFSARPERYIPFLYYKELESLIRRYEVTHIYCDHPYLAPTAILLSRRNRIPWFLRSHNLEYRRFRDFRKPWWPLFYLFEKAMMRRATGIFFITREEAEFARRQMDLESVPFCIAPFGTTLSQRPNSDPGMREKLAREYGLDPAKPWVYFLGALDYAPNQRALGHILDEILPRIRAKHQQMEWVIAGRGLPPTWISRLEKEAGCHYLGFVSDLGPLIQNCEIMLNPLTQGGGIKTKAVEALAYNKTVISTRSGAAGLDLVPLAPKLQISEDGDWEGFAENLVHALGKDWQTPDSFYRHYHWEDIAGKMLEFMERTG